MNRKLRNLFSAVIGISVFCFQTNAQQSDKNNSNPLAMESILKQGTEYDFIKPLVGKWSVKMTVYKIGGREIAAETSAFIERKMVGNFLQETMIPTTPDDPNQFTRISYFSYNRTNRRWEYTVFDTRFPITMHERSVENEIENNSITVYLDNFVAPPMWDEKHAGLLTKQRRVITFGKDENTNEQYMTFPGEDEFLAIKYVFKRIKYKR